MTRNLKQKLIEFGLFEPEAEAYLRLLKIGEGSIEHVADQTFDFADALVALDSLADKRLIQKSLAENKIYYKVNDPENVLRDLKIQKAKAKVGKDNFQKAMMNLDAFFENHPGPNEVKTYSGYSGVLKVRKKIFEETYENIYNITSLHETLPENHIQSLLRQVENNYYLLVSKADARHLADIKGIIAGQPKLKIKALGDEFWQIKSEILIFGDYAAFGDIQDQQFFTLIKDRVVVKTMERFFMTLWEKADEIEI